ncbi:MAG: hypothetical protein AAFO82_06610 [Bacteroidota bacterium]
MVKATEKEISTYIGQNCSMTKRECQRFPADRFPVHFFVCFDRTEEALSKALKNTLKAMFSSRVRYAKKSYYNTTTLDCYFNHLSDLETLIDKPLQSVRLVNYQTDGRAKLRYTKRKLLKEARSILKSNALALTKS